MLGFRATAAVQRETLVLNRHLQVPYDELRPGPANCLSETPSSADHTEYQCIGLGSSARACGPSDWAEICSAIEVRPCTSK